MTDNQLSKHVIRTSVEIVSIKNNRFYGKIYVQSPQFEQLGIRSFRTTPSLEVTRVHSEEVNFESGFGSFEAERDQKQLMAALDTGTLSFEVFHNDRVKIDKKIGKVEFDLAPLKTCEFMKTKFSYVRIYDSFAPIIEDSSDGKQTKIGELRVKIYLEDLGPVDMIAQESLEALQKNDVHDIRGNLKFEEQALKAQVAQGNAQAGELLASLEELEMKVVWELETWKKTEEAKFLFTLKQQEVEFLAKLAEEWRKKEAEKDKLFRNYETSLLAIESKLKTKALELQRRESKIVLLENEFKAKIDESAREIAKKNDTIKELKANQLELAKKHSNNVKSLEKQMAVHVAQLEAREKELLSLKAQSDTGLPAKLKKELSEKDQALERARSELKIAEQLKTELKELTAELQQEMKSLKAENEQLRSNRIFEETRSLDALRTGIGRLIGGKNDETMDGMWRELSVLKDRMSTTGGNGNSQQTNRRKSTDKQFNSAENWRRSEPITVVNENPRLKLLVDERDALLESGLPPDDILIQELESQILVLKDQ